MLIIRDPNTLSLYLLCGFQHKPRQKKKRAFEMPKQLLSGKEERRRLKPSELSVNQRHHSAPAAGLAAAGCLQVTVAVTDKEEKTERRLSPGRRRRAPV